MTTRQLNWLVLHTVYRKKGPAWFLADLITRAKTINSRVKVSASIGAYSWKYRDYRHLRINNSNIVSKRE